MEQVKNITAFFGRTGGKHFSKKRILPFIKNLEYDYYVEPFIGAGSILLGRDKKAKVEVINDYDVLVYNLWCGMKSSGNQLKNYEMYFRSKSVFKWWLLKEKQNRRLRMNKGKFKGNKKYIYEIYNNIENVKEDLFIYRQKEFGSSYNCITKDKPYKKTLNTCNCIKQNNKHSQKHMNCKVETLKEEIYVYKQKRFSQYGNETPYILRNKYCDCIQEKKENKELYSNNKNKELKIETLKEELYINKLGRFSDSGGDRPNKKLSCNDNCRDLISKDNKVETLKEDLFSYKTNCFGSERERLERQSPNIQFLNTCNCIRNDKATNKNKDCKIETLKEDLYINNKSFCGNGNEIDSLKIEFCRDIRTFEKNDICNCKRDNCMCKKTEEELRLYSEKLYKLIGKSKKEILNDFGDTTLDHFFRFGSSQFSLPIKENYIKLLKLYNLRGDFILQYPNFGEKKIPISNNKNKELKIETIIETEFDDDIVVSIEKTEEGLKLIKKKFYVRNKKFSNDETKWRIHNPNICGWKKLLENGERYYERLKDIIIYRGDYKKILNKYNNESQLTYLDPPWTKNATGKKGDKCYSNWISLDDVYNSVMKLKGYVMISYNNDNDILKKFKNWNIEYIDTIYTQKKEGKKKTQDILIMNFITHTDGKIYKIKV